MFFHFTSEEYQKVRQEEKITRKNYQQESNRLRDNAAILSN